MKIVLILFSILVLASNALFAQQEKDVRCQTTEMMQYYIKENPQVAQQLKISEQAVALWIKNHPNYRTRDVITIPVVVHLVYNIDSVNQQISDWQIASQIDALNEDYRRENADASKTPQAFQTVAADCQIQFCLAQKNPQGNATNGIIRKQTQLPYFDNYDQVKFTSEGGDDGWPYQDYFNVWVCNANGTLGYTTLPGGGLGNLDGCVVHYKAFGRINTLSQKYNLGRTLTHEAGHWLNLYHIWGDDGGNCMGSDSVADTPNQGDYNFGCPDFPLTDNCSRAFPGIMFMNYMDYVRDSCMNIFTQGQMARMWSTLNVLRPSILSSSACNIVTAHSLDIGISDISQPRLTVTAGNISPVLTMKNFGITTVTSATIYYTRNYKSTVHQFNWTGSLAGGETANVSLPEMKDSSGYQLFIAYTKNPNGQADNDTTNDIKTRSYLVNTNAAGINESPDEEMANNGFIVYPNPAFNTATLKFETFNAESIQHIEMIDVLGRQEPFTWKRISSGVIELDISQVPPSVYFIKIQAGNETMKGKMVIIR